VQVSMGKPEFRPDRIPFSAQTIQNIYELDIAHDSAKVHLSILSMGNPHAIMKVSSVNDFPVTTVGALIGTHTAFPNSVNAGFMEIVSPDHIRLRTYERGAGETFTCGSNACAAVVAGIVNHGLASEVKVELTHGNLWIEWPDKEKPVLMTGPAVHIFDGIANLNLTLMTT
jgi:diaminopimelate epimerase